MIRSAMFVEIELSNDLFFDIGIGIRSDNLILLAYAHVFQQS